MIVGQHVELSGDLVKTRTESELLFETFCVQHSLDSLRVPEGLTKTPDYHLKLGEVVVAVEIKQIESTRGFNPGCVSSRPVGWHVRKKISEARAQAQVAVRSGTPVILLIHNAIDPLQMFGTEHHDFISAMYGELTVPIDRPSLKAGQPFRGRNARLREDANTSFSGIGHIRRTRSGAAIIVYENAFASLPPPFELVPGCIELVRVEMDILTRNSLLSSGSHPNQSRSAR